MQALNIERDYLWLVCKKVHDQLACQVPFDYWMEQVKGMTDFNDIRKKAKEVENRTEQFKSKLNAIL